MSVTVESGADELHCPYCHKKTRLGMSGALDHMLQGAGAAADSNRGARRDQRRGVLLVLGIIAIAGFWLANIHFDFRPIQAETRIWDPGGCSVVSPAGDRYFVGTYRQADRSLRVLLDADTGQPTERWEHPAQTSLICIPGGRFAITNSADQIMVYESEEPSIIAGLPGELLGVAANDDCVAVRTTDDQDHVLPFPGRQAAGCRPEPVYPLGYRHGRGRCNGERPYALTSELGTFALSPNDEEGGITIVGHQPGAAAWRKSVPVACVGESQPHIGMAQANEALFVIGGAATAEAELTLLIMDPANGQPRAQFPLPGVAPPIHSVHFAGGLILIEAYDAVLGVDPVTGDVAWTFGVSAPEDEATDD